MRVEIYKWKLVLLSGKVDNFNMPHLNEPPTEDNIRAFLKNFRPYLYSQLVDLPAIKTIDWEYIGTHEI